MVGSPDNLYSAAFLAFFSRLLFSFAYAGCHARRIHSCRVDLILIAAPLKDKSGLTNAVSYAYPYRSRKIKPTLETCLSSRSAFLRPSGHVPNAGNPTVAAPPVSHLAGNHFRPSRYGARPVTAVSNAKNPLRNRSRRPSSVFLLLS